MHGKVIIISKYQFGVTKSMSNATPVVKMFGVLIFMNDLWFAIGTTLFTMVHYKLSAAQL